VANVIVPKCTQMHNSNTKVMQTEITAALNCLSFYDKPGAGAGGGCLHIDLSV